MKMELPFNLGPTSKDQELRSIVPVVIPNFGVKTSATGEQAEVKGFEDGRKEGDNDSDSSSSAVTGVTNWDVGMFYYCGAVSEQRAARCIAATGAPLERGLPRDVESLHPRA